MRGRVPPYLKVTILDQIGGKPWNFFKSSWVLSEKIYFFEKTFHQNMFQLMCKKKKFSSFTLFRGRGGPDQKCEISHFFFSKWGQADSKTVPDLDNWPRSIWAKQNIKLFLPLLYSETAVFALFLCEILIKFYTQWQF